MHHQRPIRVFFLYRFRVLGDALSRALAREPTIELVSGAWAGSEISEALDRWPADLALLDSRLGSESLRSILRHLRPRFPALKIVPVGLRRQDEILDLIESGADGFVDTSADLEQLKTTVRETHRGRSPCPSNIAGAVLERILQLSSAGPKSTGNLQGPKRPGWLPGPGAKPQRLTPREHEVLSLVAVGLQNKEIAQRLEISLATVKNHVHRILEKMQVSRRREAIRLASVWGLLHHGPGSEDS